MSDSTPFRKKLKLARECLQCETPKTRVFLSGQPLKENHRIVLMFCALEGPPKIVRLHGHGEAIEPLRADFKNLLSQFPEQPGVRAIVRVALTRVADSCGFGVPLFEFQGERTTLGDWARKKGPQEVAAYQQAKNLRSLNGLPGLLDPAAETRQ